MEYIYWGVCLFIVGLFSFGAGMSCEYYRHSKDWSRRMKKMEAASKEREDELDILWADLNMLNDDGTRMSLKDAMKSKI